MRGRYLCFIQSDAPKLADLVGPLPTSPNLQLSTTCTFTIDKCHAIQQPKSHAICVMIGGSGATVVKASRVPTAAMPSAIVSQLFLAVDGRTEQTKPSY